MRLILLLLIMFSDKSLLFAETLEEKLLSKDPAIYGAAINELSIMDSNTKNQIASTLLPTLRQMMKDEDKNKRFCAVSALDLLGPAAKDAIPDLKLALQDNNTS